MRLARIVMVAALCAAPMIASAGFTPRDTIQSHSNAAPVNVPEPGTLALLLAGVAGVVATRRRRRDKNDR